MPRGPLLLLGLGSAAAVTAAVLRPAAASGAAAQTWPAFVMVAGLLLIGMVAAADGLFSAAGARLARSAPGGTILFAGVAILVAVVTAVLNLDTSVAFLAPVMVHTARRRGEDDTVLLALCLLMSNAASLLLPGSNLTNLIVLGSRHISGAGFLARMAVPWVAAVAVTAGVVAWRARDRLRLRVEAQADEVTLVPGAGLVGIVAVVVVVLAVPSPAPVVAGTGIVLAAVAVARRQISLRAISATLDFPVLAGLFGVAVGLGAAGRAWTGPAEAMSHLGPWLTAAGAAVASILVNNLPAAALLSARPPAHPLSLLIGLDLGPNLFVSGSLSWVLWHSSARGAGGSPDVRGTVKVGLVAAPLSIVAAVAALHIAGGGT